MTHNLTCSIGLQAGVHSQQLSTYVSDDRDNSVQCRVTNDAQDRPKRELAGARCLSQSRRAIGVIARRLRFRFSIK